MEDRFEAIEKICVPMKGRMLHDKAGATVLVPYGQGDQAILSVSRNVLNAVIMQELKKFPNLEIIFNSKCKGVDKNGVVTLESTKASGQEPPVRRKISSKLVVGADGAFSEVRQSLLRHARVNCSQTFFKLGYKELQIDANALGEYAIADYNCLHIWPRKDFMIIALPNPDKTFTCTLFLSWEGKEGLDYLEKKATDTEILEFMMREFGDLVPLVPDLLQQWHANPASALINMRCDPWIFEDKIVLIGDSAHATLPFFGQGMNCAFEDARSLDILYGKHNGDLKLTLQEYSATRQKAGDALQELSQENYVEMSYTSSLWWFQAKKKIELVFILFLFFIHEVFEPTFPPILDSQVFYGNIY